MYPGKQHGLVRNAEDRIGFLRTVANRFPDVFGHDSTEREQRFEWTYTMLRTRLYVDRVVLCL